MTHDQQQLQYKILRHQYLTQRVKELKRLLDNDEPTLISQVRDRLEEQLVTFATAQVRLARQIDKDSCLLEGLGSDSLDRPFPPAPPESRLVKWGSNEQIK